MQGNIGYHKVLIALAIVDVIAFEQPASDANFDQLDTASFTSSRIDLACVDLMPAFFASFKQ